MSESVELLDNNDDLPEVDTGDDHVEPEPKAYRAWEQQEVKEKELPSSIPYNRFKEVNDERKTYLTKLEEAEAQLAKYREREETVKSIKSPKDIKIEDYTDPQDYLQDLTAATKHQAVLEVEERQAQRDRKKAIDDQVKATNDLFELNVKEAAKRDPNVPKAKDWFDRVAHNINPAVAYELMIDENVGELMLDIASDQNLVNEMFSSNPNDFIRKLHKMSAKINREERYGQSREEQPTRDRTTRTTMPKALTDIERIRESVPKAVSSQSVKPSDPRRAKTAGEYLAMKRAQGK